MTDGLSLILALIGIAGGGGGGSVTPSVLADLMEGSDPLAVDLNEAGTKVNVHFDLTDAQAGYTLRVSSDGTKVEFVSVDSTVTESSNNLVTSGAVFNAIEDAAPAPTASDLGKFLKASTSGPMWVGLPNADAVAVVYEAPTSVNPSGLKFAVLTSEPATKYDGWFYIITSA